MADVLSLWASSTLLGLALLLLQVLAQALAPLPLEVHIEFSNNTHRARAAAQRAYAARCPGTVSDQRTTRIFMKWTVLKSIPNDLDPRLESRIRARFHMRQHRSLSQGLDQ